MTFTEYPDCTVKGGRWFRGSDGLAVIVSTDTRGGIEWTHVSASRAKSTPHRRDMAIIKSHFIGDDRDAVEYWPPATEYVNDHPNVLHLWARADGQRILPDMRAFESLLGRLSI